MISPSLRPRGIGMPLWGSNEICFAVTVHISVACSGDGVMAQSPNVWMHEIAGPIVLEQSPLPSLRPMTSSADIEIAMTQCGRPRVPLEGTWLCSCLVRGPLRPLRSKDLACLLLREPDMRLQAPGCPLKYINHRPPQALLVYRNRSSTIFPSSSGPHNKISHPCEPRH